MRRTSQLTETGIGLSDPTGIGADFRIPPGSNLLTCGSIGNSTGNLGHGESKKE
jgi:hypothetical protein